MWIKFHRITLNEITLEVTITGWCHWNCFAIVMASVCYQQVPGIKPGWFLTSGLSCDKHHASTP